MVTTRLNICKNDREVHVCVWGWVHGCVTIELKRKL